MSMDALVARTPFKTEEELVDFLVENRSVNLAKLVERTRLSLPELRRLMASRDFRRKCTEALSLTVISMDQEERIIRNLALAAEDETVRVGDRVKAASFVMRHAGLERARETKVDVDHGVRVVFEPIAREAIAWRPPDPFAGVVGAPELPQGQRALVAPAGTVTVEGDHPQEEPEVDDERDEA